MRKALLLAAVLIVVTLPPAFALNCTLYEGEHGELCGVIDPLPLSEEDKTSLLYDGIYGTIDTTQEPVALNLNLPSSEQITLNDVYESNIVRAWNILLFILVHYVAYAITTRSSFFSQWLNVDYLT